MLFGSSTRDRYAYICGRSENNIKCIVHDDLGWKNQTTIYSAVSLALQVIFDFLSFIVVNHIRFFHGAFQFSAVMVARLSLGLSE